MLPPLMFSEEEIEALVLGSRWVAERADGPLSKAARNALAKIVAVLPGDMRDGAETTGLLVGPGVQIADGDAELATIRQAIRAQRKLAIAYVNQDGT
jgi:predicted DNA-binding transcriptional regulator YafY